MTPAASQIRFNEHSRPIDAEVLDISTTGIQLRLGAYLIVGSDITIYFGRTVARGEVRYCRRNTANSFDAGLQLADALDRISPSGSAA